MCGMIHIHITIVLLIFYVRNYYSTLLLLMLHVKWMFLLITSNISSLQVHIALLCFYHWRPWELFSKANFVCMELPFIPNKPTDCVTDLTFDTIVGTIQPLSQIEARTLQTTFLSTSQYIQYISLIDWSWSFIHASNHFL